MIVDATLGAEVVQDVINFSGAGDNIVVAGTANQRIRVLQFFYIVAAATNITFKSGTTALTGVMDFTTNGAHVQDYMQLPINCGIGQNFIINSSNPIQVGGMIWYIKL